MATKFRGDATKAKTPGVCTKSIFPPSNDWIGAIAAPPPAWIQGLPPVLFALMGVLPAAVAAAVVQLPAKLAIFTYWLDLNVDPPIDITEAFNLTYRPETADYYGASSLEGLRLVAEIDFLAAPGHYDLNLSVYRGAAFLDDDSWHDVFAGVPPRFDTTELEHVHTPKVDSNGAHAVS